MDRRKIRARVSRIVLIVSLGLVVLASAAPTPADVVRSSSAFAYASYYIEEGDCRTAATVTVGKEIVQGTAQPTTIFLYMQLERWGCLEGTNYAIGTFRDIPASEFQIDANVESATLDTSLVESDRVSGVPIELTLHLEWANTGQLQQTQHSHSHLVTPGSVSNQRQRLELWEADLTGTISDGQTEYARGPGTGALQSFHAGSVMIDRMRMEAAFASASASAPMALRGPMRRMR